ncbi:MAG: hypothetical protein IJG50_03935 [Clostridia bacterium]|nr:hypothetical protein [Clostridia bacterium]
MDLQHKMLRSTIDVLINKTIVDIQSDTHRSIRNFIDLGVYFAKGKNQKRFFLRMQSTIQDPQNPFYKLVSDMLDNIDTDIIKSLGTNLGCSSFTYGVNTIRKNEPLLGVHIPPLVFHMPGDGPGKAGALKRTGGVIAQGMELGVYTHAFYVNSDMQRARDVFTLAGEYAICSFFMLIEPQLVTDDFLLMAQGVNNVIISVKAAKGCEDEACAAFRKLHEARLMFGFHADYDEDTMDYLSSDAFLDPFIETGCFFGGYIYRGENKAAIPEKMRDFVRLMRTGEGKPILLFDWFDDLNYIIKVVSPGGDLLMIDDGADTARARTAPDEKAVKMGERPLEDVLKEVMPEL